MLPRFFSIVLVLSPFVIGAASIQGAEPRELTNSIGMKLVRIEPGSFMMGQDGPPSDYHIAKHPEKFDDADREEKPAHRVTITRPFHMGATEVTLAQYCAMAACNSSSARTTTSSISHG